MKPLQRFRNINSQTVLPALIRRREQANEIEIERLLSLGETGRVEEQCERVVAVRRILAGDQLKGVLNPLARRGFALDLDATKDLVVLEGAPQLRGENSVVRAVDPERPRVGLLANVDAPEPVVKEARSPGGVAAGGNGHGDWEGLGQRGVQAVEGQVGVVERVPGVEGDRELVAVLKGSVADQLGVNSSFSTIVDICSCK